MTDQLDTAPTRTSAEGWSVIDDGTPVVGEQTPETLSAIHHRQQSDPRPDLAADSALWSRALALEWHKDHDHVSLWSILFVFRCNGARVEWRTKKDGGRFLAIARGEIEPAEYTRDATQRLKPYQERLSALMRHLAAEEACVEGMEVAA